MSKTDWIAILRLIHVVSAVLLVGGAFYGQFVLRWAAKSIPPAQAATIMQRAGTAYTRIVVWPALTLLVMSGLLRLHYMNLLPQIFHADFIASRYGRWLLVMMLGWLTMSIITLVFNLFLVPPLLRKLNPNASPGPADVINRQGRLLKLAKWVQWGSLVGLIAGVIATIAGASLLAKGGLF